MLKSWKSTLLGIAAILSGIGNLDLTSLLGAGEVGQLAPVLAGIGLLFARDNDVTSEKAGAK